MDSSKKIIRRLFSGIAAAAAVCGGIMLIAGCASRPSGNDSDSADSLPVKEPEAPFHANNDIAMTVRSIIDAIRNGQELDSLTYNFTGVLTDGAGAPLYIDAQDSPGQWEVKVSGTKAVICNLYLGNLDSDALRHYIADEAELDEKDMTRHGEISGPGKVELTDYKFDGGRIHFEETEVMAANGEHGPLLKITISSEEEEGSPQGS